MLSDLFTRLAESAISGSGSPSSGPGTVHLRQPPLFANQAMDRGRWSDAFGVTPSAKTLDEDRQTMDDERRPVDVELTPSAETVDKGWIRPENRQKSLNDIAGFLPVRTKPVIETFPTGEPDGAMIGIDDSHQTPAPADDYSSSEGNLLPGNSIRQLDPSLIQPALSDVHVSPLWEQAPRSDIQDQTSITQASLSGAPDPSSIVQGPSSDTQGERWTPPPFVIQGPSSNVETPAPAGQSAPPAIRITIGRIEIRAAQPASSAQPVVPSSRPAVQPAGPNLSLDAYLKKRSEGTR